MVICYEDRHLFPPVLRRRSVSLLRSHGYTVCPGLPPRDPVAVDLRFVAADDETVFNHRIESFDSLLGVAYIWVDVPEMQGGARQDIWMYYGNPDAPALDSSQIFDADYAAVYHFDSAPGATVDDATAYANDTQNSVPGTTSGVIAQAAQFSGEPLLLPASPSLSIPESGQFTFSAWVRTPQSTGEQLLYARRDAGNSLLIGLENGLPTASMSPRELAPTSQLQYQWPKWGQHGRDLAIGDSGAPGGSGGECDQGDTYRGTAGEICGGQDNWGATDIEVWYPRTGH